ncbi:FecR domain-containing protein [Asticcacaulis sp. EMRT-3]|uniref:FecR family protein n=1 Tax=Asticcacaulis sp. EMRT-3 TaxID=3040349 RepID=UPI0024AFCE57|nr:FecR domain-containing protein [Asticcacaulis sp. EMRT-3]MDI7776258.1 FecR domain-containing protein [Asticcacaulis sp. EMRT-3]
MTNDEIRTDAYEDQAIAWVVRAHASDMSDEDILALTEWLEADPAHLAAFDAAERAWMGEAALIASPEPTTDIIDLTQARVRRTAKPAPSRRLWLAVGAVAAALTGLALLPGLWSAQKPVIYTTSVGQTREVALADGTHLHLNSATRLEVLYSRKSRDIVLDQGEVALTVMHDAERPFSVRAGEAVLRDVGTEFDVLRHDGTVTVTVKSGAVAMLKAGETTQTPPPDRILHAGDQAVIEETSARAERSRVMVGQAFDWERGQAVYRNRSLAYVVSDLNRYFDKPIEVDADTGKLNVTAVFTLDSEAAVVRHLQVFLPVEATETDKAIMLRRRP